VSPKATKHRSTWPHSTSTICNSARESTLPDVHIASFIFTQHYSTGNWYTTGNVLRRMCIHHNRQKTNCCSSCPYFSTHHLMTRHNNLVPKIQFVSRWLVSDVWRTRMFTCWLLWTGVHIYVLDHLILQN